MIQKHSSPCISMSVLMFLTYCVSSNSFSLIHHQRVHNSHVPGHVESSCNCFSLQNYRRVLNQREDLVRKYHPSTFRALNRLSAAKLFRMSSTPNCHPDDDPNSGSVLPVKDRIALYSQVARSICLNIYVANSFEEILVAAHNLVLRECAV
jgi:hypothetical protein